jgi:hypothetical protein
MIGIGIILCVCVQLMSWMICIIGGRLTFLILFNEFLLLIRTKGKQKRKWTLFVEMIYNYHQFIYFLFDA